jgi:hypothetical protein
MGRNVSVAPLEMSATETIDHVCHHARMYSPLITEEDLEKLLKCAQHSNGFH